MGKIPHILVVPFPAQGHVTPLIELSQRLVDHGFKITFVNIESIHKKMASTFLNHDEEKFHLVSIPDGLCFQGVDNLTIFMSETMPFHVEELIKKINDIDCLVADATVGTIVAVAEKLGIKSAAIWPSSLSVLAFMFHFPKLVESGDIDENGIPNPKKTEATKLPDTMPAMNTFDAMWGYSEHATMRQIVMEFINNVNLAARLASWILCNSFNELEPASHNFIPNLLTIGPLLATGERIGHNGQLLPEDSTCLAWLDRQSPQSVTYIAFGSTTIFDSSQFNEVVHCLELMEITKRPFLWVVRPGLIPDMSLTVLETFKASVAHCGRVVDWAPQQKVLAHSSVACFVTHCGWNSTMEGVSNGIPLLCWPYAADQFHNQNYICDIWKVGLKLEKDGNGVITGFEIKTKVEELLGHEEIRSRVNELKDMARRSVGEDGSSSKNFKNFVNWTKSLKI